METPQAPHLWTRRQFVQSSLTGLALLGCRIIWPGNAFSSSLPEGRIRLYNTHTDEHLTVQYRSRAGRYDRGALKDINYLLRCNHSKTVHRMDIRLVEFINHIEKAVGRGKEVHIYSGYRSKSYNDILVLHEQGAVTNSFHTKGQAMDFSIPGIRLASVRRAAVKIRQGGVGYYRQQGFIHIDSGPARSW